MKNKLEEKSENVFQNSVIWQLYFARKLWCSLLIEAFVPNISSLATTIKELYMNRVSITQIFFELFDFKIK